MARDHRFFHRRAAQPQPQVATVIVEVIATVDADGNIIAQDTQTSAVAVATDVSVPSVASAVAEDIASVVADVVPSGAADVITSAVAQDVASAVAEVIPTVVADSTVADPSVADSTVADAQVPTVPAVPTVAAVSIPSVPSVPPFPSDLVVPTVPSYPWPSGVAAVQAVASTNAIVPSAALTSAIESSTTPAPALISATSPGFNSTTSTGIAGFPSASTFVSLDSNSGASALSASQALLWSRTAFASDSATITTSSDTAMSTGTDTTSNRSGGGTGIAGNTAGAPAATTATNSGSNTDNSPAPLETPQVVGSIVGSLAGAALILAIVLFLIRRHKRRRGGALQLTGDDHTDRHHPMTQAVASRGAIPSAFLHRFSVMSRSTVDTTTSGGAPSFQRVSGRKLPSAFSEGMTSDQFSRGGTISGSSFYQDEQGTYGGPGLSKEMGKEIGDTSTNRNSVQMNIRPSPARTPVIRHPDDVPPVGIKRSHLSPPQSPNPALPGRGALGRSLHSADGSRSSRFTENV